VCEEGGVAGDFLVEIDGWVLAGGGRIVLGIIRIRGC